MDFDIRPLGDIQGDAQELPFRDESFDKVIAHDVVEHFPRAKTEKVVNEWKRVLKKGGIIEFRLPNLASICRSFTKGEIGAEKTSWLLYGGQGYKYNFHYAGFNEESFKSIVEMKCIESKNEGYNITLKFRREK